MTLTEFLLARIAEDEADAREASGERLWRWSQHDDMISPGAGHMQRFTPARMLAECEAKRRIVADAMAPPPAGDNLTDYMRGIWAQRNAMLFVLAAVHSDHPDYRPEWKPADTRE